MNQFEERSPYLSETLVSDKRPSTTASNSYTPNVPWAVGIIIILAIVIIIYLYFLKGHTHEHFSENSKPDDMGGYLDTQINLLNRLQHKNMSGR
jgi:hypothetical protein